MKNSNEREGGEGKGGGVKEKEEEKAEKVGWSSPSMTAQKLDVHASPETQKQLFHPS